MTTVDLTPSPVHLKLYRGDDLRVNVPVLDDDGDAIDLTGYTFAAHIRGWAADATEADVTTVALTITPSTDPAGLVMVGAADDLDALDTDGQYAYDFQATAPDGTTRTWFGGAVTITDDTTD